MLNHSRWDFIFIQSGLIFGQEISYRNFIPGQIGNELFCDNHLFLNAQKATCQYYYYYECFQILAIVIAYICIWYRNHSKYGSKRARNAF